MKRFLLSAVAGILALSASAAFSGTTFYEENFVKMGMGNNNVPTEGWVTRGNNLKPDGEISEYYFVEEDKILNYILMNAGTQCYAMCTTCYADNTPADQWLISPEIEIPYDNATLTFDAVGYAALGQLPYGANTFDVKVSEGGVEPDDFTTVLSASVNSSLNVEITSKTCGVGINGYKGKKVRIAFVATGSNVGFTGFSNISLSQYSVLVAQNLSSDFVTPKDVVTVDYNLRMKAPVACTTIKADLEFNGKTYEQSVKRSIGSATSSSLQLIRFSFDNLGTLEPGDSKDYVLTITPDFEGAIPAKLTGTVVCPNLSYPNNVVVEELTATGCSWCPRGFAALEYYLDTFKGSDSEGKAIAIAIHGYMNHADPMNVGVNEYYQKLLAMSGGGLPGGVFNRATRQQDPTAISNVTGQLAQKAYSFAEITNVEVPSLETTDIFDIIGKDMKVKYKVKNAYSTLNRPLNASVVLIEDDVKGYNQDYAQDNSYYSFTTATIAQNWGNWIVPYMEKYASGGELGMQLIPASKMVYEHVARLCYPTFYGETISEEWKEDEYKDFEFTFPVPDNIMNIENTSLILLITSPNEDNKIVSSDILPYSDFIRTNGVNEISTEGFPAEEIFTIDGIKVNGQQSALSPGIYIVRSGNSVKKIMVK